MIKRPNKNDSESDIIQMQKEFLAAKNNNTNFEPAAKVVRLNKDREPSNFAKQRGLITSNQPNVPTQTLPVIGDIIERKTDISIKLQVKDREINENGFPKPTRIQRKTSDGTKSLFALSRTQTQADKPNTSNTEEEQLNLSTAYGSKSFILDNAEAQNIHEGNIQMLQQIDEKEILAERQKLLESLDPSLISFLRSKRKNTAPNLPNVDTTLPKIVENMEPEPITILENTDILNWHLSNMDVKIEPEKLEWMKDIPNELSKLKPGESYEARFDWKGILLPYNMETTNDDRELFLHGDDVQRPGYTLQELFRFARSNIIQQRISAITSISGMLNLYNQGYYDKVLDLPISKIFFLLRFAFDDNTPSLLEATSNALATFLYNDCDEILLDFIYESSNDFQEPALELIRADDIQNESSLENQFKNINLNSSKTSVLHSNFVEDEAVSNASLNDFHLAETDLIQCVLRSNIVQRISYILFTVRPENKTVLSCFKILIRLARTNKSIAEAILHHNNLMTNIFNNFLPTREGSDSTRYYNKPQYLILKLLRVTASYSSEICKHLECMGLYDILKYYIFMKSDITINLIKIQIEAFRLVKVVTVLNNSSNLYNDILPALMYMLEWCYQFVNFDQGSSSIFRTYASALIALIGCKNVHCATDLLPQKLNLCFSKWFHIAKIYGRQEFTQNILLSTCLNTSTRFVGNYFTPFYVQYLKKFLESTHFLNMSFELRNISPLLSSVSLRTDKHEPLPILDSMVLNKSTPSFIFGQKYSIDLHNSIINLLNTMRTDDKLFKDLFEVYCNEGLMLYLNQISGYINLNLKKNWFVKTELTFLVNLIKCQELRNAVNKTELQKVAHNLICCLSEYQINEAKYIFENIVFNVDFYNNKLDYTKSDLDKWKRIYIKICLPGNIYQFIQNRSLTVMNYNELILTNDWIHLPLLTLLKSVSNNADFLHKDILEQDIITASISFTCLRNANSLGFVSPTEELMFYMIAFMGPECSFLEPSINTLLRNNVEIFFARNNNTVFELEKQFEGRSKFESLYILFLDHFQGTSYGDEIFGALAMVPLSNKYDIKWRNMIWSEHVSVLRFINCNENQIIGTLDDYLHPNETDVTLLKSYSQALNSNILREGSVPYKIATNHLKNYKFQNINKN